MLSCTEKIQNHILNTIRKRQWYVSYFYQYWGRLKNILNNRSRKRYYHVQHRNSLHYLEAWHKLHVHYCRFILNYIFQQYDFGLKTESRILLYTLHYHCNDIYILLKFWNPINLGWYGSMRSDPVDKSRFRCKYVKSHRSSGHITVNSNCNPESETPEGRRITTVNHLVAVRGSFHFDIK